MFVLTLGKKSLRRLGAVAVCGVVLAGTVFAVGSFFKQDEAVPTNADTSQPQVNVQDMKIEGAESISAFFQSFGLEVDLSTATVDKVKIPKKWDESFSAFNTVVKESGLDLKDNKGKSVEKWLALCPTRSSGDQKCYGVLLVYKEKPVGAYLLNQPSGEVLGLASVSQTPMPLGSDQAAKTAAEFGTEVQQVSAEAPEAEQASADEVENAEQQAQQVSGDFEEELNLEEVGAEPVE